MDNLINQLLYNVKSSKKYKTIADEIIISEINNYLKKNKIKEIKEQDIKQIKEFLHMNYASFQTKKKKKLDEYLNELKNKIDNNKNIYEETKKLLSVTLSTKERLDNYQENYKKIFQITGTPKTILDLGSGFNAFSYPFMNLKEITYYAYDINKQDTDYINEYFKIMKPLGLNGKAAILDLKNSKEISCLPSTDIIFLWKIIDILDKNNHKPSEELIRQLIIKKKAKYIVASFATKTLTRKQMNHPKRKWFELMLQRINLKFQLIEMKNEVFYVISK